MITKELIDRINFLARKKRAEGLTPEEEMEQSEVRRQYIDGIKDQIKPMLDDFKKGNTDGALQVEAAGHEDGCSCEHCRH